MGRFGLCGGGDTHLGMLVGAVDELASSEAVKYFSLAAVRCRKGLARASHRVALLDLDCRGRRHSENFAVAAVGVTDVAQASVAVPQAVARAVAQP